MRRIRIPCLYVNYPLEDGSKVACTGFGPVVCLNSAFIECVIRNDH
jgi:hypothetical protein